MIPKKYYLVLDTETANDVQISPLVYDIGFAICDRKGKIYYEKSYICKDIFYSDNKALMASPYYACKLPQYHIGIANKQWQVATIWEIRREIIRVMKKYGIKEIYAYNVGFDSKALNQSIRYISKSFMRWFFPYGTQFKCIWHMATQLLMARPSYIHRAIANNWISDAGNIYTNAEKCYSYIVGNTNFEEDHTGLSDVKIEIAILVYCLRQHKKFESRPNQGCWQIVQNKRKELYRNA